MSFSLSLVSLRLLSLPHSTFSLPGTPLQCRQRRAFKPLHSRRMRSIAPWRYTILSQKRYNTFRKSTTANGPSFVARNPEWQVRTVLGDCISRARVILVQAPQYPQCVLISNFMDLANLSIQEEAALATNWIKDRPTGTLPENVTADVHCAINKCESWGSGKQLVLHGNPSALAKDSSPAHGSPSTSFFAECALPVLHVAPGHPRWRF